MCTVVLSDDLNLVRAEADVDNRGAGPGGLSMIVLALSLALCLRAHRGETNTQKHCNSPEYGPHSKLLHFSFRFPCRDSSVKDDKNRMFVQKRVWAMGISFAGADLLTIYAFDRIAPPKR